MKALGKRVLIAVPKMDETTTKSGLLYVPPSADTNAIVSGLVLSAGPEAPADLSGSRVWFNRFTAAKIFENTDGAVYSVTTDELFAQEEVNS